MNDNTSEMIDEISKLNKLIVIKNDIINEKDLSISEINLKLNNQYEKNEEIGIKLNVLKND